MDKQTLHFIFMFNSKKYRLRIKRRNFPLNFLNKRRFPFILTFQDIVNRGRMTFKSNSFKISKKIYRVTLFSYTILSSELTSSEHRRWLKARRVCINTSSIDHFHLKRLLFIWLITFDPVYVFR